MPPRATWKGHLRLSLVTIGVRMHNATTTASRISFNQLHKDCHRRLRQQMVCPEHGPVDRAEIVKGYEYEKGAYVIVDDEDVRGLRLETTHTIEITQFVDPDELDPIYFDSPYYLGPDGPVNEEAFRVVREAMKRLGKVGIGRFVVGGREHVVALLVKGRGFVLNTLRAASEVRDAEEFWDGIQNGEVDRQKLDLAEKLVEMSVAPLDTSDFRDRYQDALLAVVQAKVEGAEPVVAQETEVVRTLNFMDALRTSLREAGVAEAGAAGGKAATGKKKPATRKKPPAKSVGRGTGKTTKKKKA